MPQAIATARAQIANRFVVIGNTLLAVHMSYIGKNHQPDKGSLTTVRLQAALS